MYYILITYPEQQQNKNFKNTVIKGDTVCTLLTSTRLMNNEGDTYVCIVCTYVLILRNKSSQFCHSMDILLLCTVTNFSAGVTNIKYEYILLLSITYSLVLTYVIVIQCTYSYSTYSYYVSYEGLLTYICKILYIRMYSTVIILYLSNNKYYLLIHTYYSYIHTLF